MFSICQCIKHSSATCDFSKNFSGKSKPAAIDCDGSFSDWKLGILENVAAKPMKAYELVDGVIVYWKRLKEKTVDVLINICNL